MIGRIYSILFSNGENIKGDFMNKNVKSYNIGNIIIYIIMGTILLAIGLDIGMNLYFFMIDNPGILVAGQAGSQALIVQIVQNPRLDFMYNIIIFLGATCFGNTPTVYFLIQFFCYVFTIIVVLCFVSKCCNKKTIAAACAGSLIWCSSVGENLYTIGKKEIFLSLGMSVFIVLLYKLVFEIEEKYKRILTYIFYVLAMFFSLTLKETSNIIILTALLLFLYTLIYKREYLRNAFGGILGVFFVVICTQLYKRTLIENSSYTSYVLSFNTIVSNIWFYFRYHMDVCFIGVIGLVSNMILFIKDRRNEKYAFLLIINLTGWGYVGGLCLWRWPQSYYIYPVVLFFAMSIVGFSLVQKGKSILKIVCFLCVIFILYGVTYNYCVAKSHKDIGIIYTDSIYKLNDIAEDGDRVIIDDADMYEEPPFQMSNLLINYFGNQIEIYGGKQSIWNTEVSDERLLLYGYTREQYEEEKENATLKVGDYLIHYINDRNFYGPIRAVNPAVTEDTISYLNSQGYSLQLIDEEMLTSRYFGWANGALGIHDMQAGYEIYKVLRVGCEISGITEDGWSGNKILIENYNKELKYQIDVLDLGTAINKYTSNTIRIYVDGIFEENIEVMQGSVIDLGQFIIEDFGENHTIELFIERTFVPAMCDENSNDNRNLGINIRLESTE